VRISRTVNLAGADFRLIYKKKAFFVVKIRETLKKWKNSVNGQRFMPKKRIIFVALKSDKSSIK
jgi:hypothetical protein